MKTLLEAINKSILQELNNNIQLLSDIDNDNDISQINISSKSVNNNVLHPQVAFKYEFINTIDSLLNFNGTVEKMRRVMNDPKNFKVFNGIVKANNKKHLMALIKLGIKILGNDGNFNWIDTSEITDMSWLFHNNSKFNGHIELWDVSNVTDMSNMFDDAASFNQPIGDWDVSNVTSMKSMFIGAGKFNQPIGDWDVSNVTDMGTMFLCAYKFNQPIGNWDVSAVTNMGSMFSNAKKFNQPIGDWDVSNVADMREMFWNANSFNQDISDWNINDKTDTKYMFEAAKNFSSKYKPKKYVCHEIAYRNNK